jgi:hypothetical protein
MYFPVLVLNYEQLHEESGDGLELYEFLNSALVGRK